MLIKKTRRLNQRKPRLLTRMYHVSLDDLRELQQGEEVDVSEKSARLLVRHGFAVEVKGRANDEPPEPAEKPGGIADVGAEDEVETSPLVPEKDGGIQLSGSVAYMPDDEPDDEPYDEPANGNDKKEDL